MNRPETGTASVRQKALSARRQLQGEKAFTKRDKETGQYMDVKKDEKFKGVRKED